jgi:hypothetical protein
MNFPNFLLKAINTFAILLLPFRSTVFCQIRIILQLECCFCCKFPQPLSSNHWNVFFQIDFSNTYSILLQLCFQKLHFSICRTVLHLMSIHSRFFSFLSYVLEAKINKFSCQQTSSGENNFSGTRNLLASFFFAFFEGDLFSTTGMIFSSSSSEILLFVMFFDELSESSIER